MCATTEDARRLLERVTVLANERQAEGVGLLTLDAPGIAARVDPGQFVHLLIARGAEFILRRPFSVHRAGEDRIELLYQVLGRGTRALSDSAAGGVMDAIGPLGSGWRIPQGAAHALVVAGGLGVAPMGMLVERLARSGVATTVAHGAPTAERLLAREVLSDNASRVLTATDDGSAGHRGLVTALSRDLVAEGHFDVVYACGPEAMSHEVARQAQEAGTPCQVSLERLMACGVGACLSCVVSTHDGLLKACVDGPVFDAERVAWDQAEIPPRH